MTNKTYQAQLVANENYTIALVGAYDYKLTGDVNVINDNANAVVKDIILNAVPTYQVSGKFLGLTQVRGEYETLNVNPDSISFKNVEDGYTYSGTIENGTYKAVLRDGSYQASIVSADYATSTHIVVSGGAVTRDLLLKDLTPEAVAYSDTLYVGADKAYKTVQSAINAVDNMTRTEGQRVTIKVDPGTYLSLIHI